jgi:hypothetical protein
MKEYAPRISDRYSAHCTGRAILRHHSSRVGLLLEQLDKVFGEACDHL